MEENKTKYWISGKPAPKQYVWKRLNSDGDVVGTFIWNGWAWVEMPSGEDELVSLKYICWKYE